MTVREGSLDAPTRHTLETVQPGVVYAGLALNDKGYDRLRETGLDEVHLAFAASAEPRRVRSSSRTIIL